MQAGTAQSRLTAGFRHRLRRLLGSLPPETREAEVERLISQARVRASRDGVPLPDALLAVHENARQRWPSPVPPPEPPRFLCDASLEGLARWLRAAGYVAERPPAGVPVHRLADEALGRGLVLLTTDAETLERRIVGDGSLRVLWLPSSLTTNEKLGLVLRDLGLALREPRCMACGGELAARPKEDVRPRIPPRTASWKDEYFVCVTCDRLFWRGTHWERIARALSAALAR